MVWPDGVDSSLKQTITDWYTHREVCDNDKFPLFFKRKLTIALPRYNQLLRIEPGVSQYDWLVQKYTELQRLSTESGTMNRATVSEKEMTGAESGLRSNTQTNNLTDTVYTDGAVSEANGGTVNKNTAYGKTVSNSGSVSSSGSNTETGAIHDVGTQSNNSDSKGLAKAAPQSMSYAAGGFPSTMDWTYPGSQSEQKNTSSGEDRNTRTFDNHRNANTSSTTDNRSSSQGGNDLETTTDSRTKTNLHHDTTQTNKSGTVIDQSSESNTKTGSENATSRTGGSDSKSGDERVRESGRDVDIATLLQNAKAFIAVSSAFEWLRGNLEDCFMGIYDL